MAFSMASLQASAIPVSSEYSTRLSSLHVTCQWRKPHQFWLSDMGMSWHQRLKSPKILLTYSTDAGLCRLSQLQEVWFHTLLKIYFLCIHAHIQCPVNVWLPTLKTVWFPTLKKTERKKEVYFPQSHKKVWFSTKKKESIFNSDFPLSNSLISSIKNKMADFTP